MCLCEPGYSRFLVIDDTMHVSPVDCGYCVNASGSAYTRGGTWVFANGGYDAAWNGTCSTVLFDCGPTANVPASLAARTCVCAHGEFFNGFRCGPTVAPFPAGPGTVALYAAVGSSAITSYDASRASRAVYGVTLRIVIIDFETQPPAWPSIDDNVIDNYAGRAQNGLGTGSGFVSNATGVPAVYLGTQRVALELALPPLAAVLTCGSGSAGRAALGVPLKRALFIRPAALSITAWDIPVQCTPPTGGSSVTWCAKSTPFDSMCDGDLGHCVGVPPGSGNTLPVCACSSVTHPTLATCPPCSTVSPPSAVRSPYGDHRTCIPLSAAIAVACPGVSQYLGGIEVLPSAGSAWAPADLIRGCGCGADRHLDFSCTRCAAPYVYDGRRTGLTNETCIPCPPVGCGAGCTVLGCSAPGDVTRTYDPDYVVIACNLGYTGPDCTLCALGYRWLSWRSACVACPPIRCVHGTNECAGVCRCASGWYGPACDMVPYANGVCTLTSVTAARHCICNSPFAENVATRVCSGCVVGYVPGPMVGIPPAPICTPLSDACGSNEVDPGLSAAAGECRCSRGYIFVTRRSGGGSAGVCASRATECGTGRADDTVVYEWAASENRCGCGSSFSEVPGTGCVSRLSLCGPGGASVAAPPAGGTGPGVCVCGPGWAPLSHQPTPACTVCAPGYVPPLCGACAFTCARNEVCGVSGCDCVVGRVRDGSGACSLCAAGYVGPGCARCPIAVGPSIGCVVEDGPPWHAALICAPGYSGYDCSITPAPEEDCPAWCALVGGACNGTASCICPYPTAGPECRECAPGYVATPRCVRCATGCEYVSAVSRCVCGAPPPPRTGDLVATSSQDGCPSCPAAGAVRVCGGSNLSAAACVCGSGLVATASPEERLCYSGPLGAAATAAAQVQATNPWTLLLLVGSTTIVSVFVACATARVLWRSSGYGPPEAPPWGV